MTFKRFMSRVAAVTAVLLLPHSATAFSFLPGGFAPGEKILSLAISAACVSCGFDVDGGTPFDFTDDIISYTSAISQITTTLGSYTVPLGDVLLTGSMEIIPSPIFADGFAQTAGALLQKNGGITADLAITDVGVGGVGSLLYGDFQTNGEMLIQGFAGQVTGTFGGFFDTVGGNAGFLDAWTDPGNLLGNLGGLQAGGVEVTDVCAQITDSGMCLPASPPEDFKSFTANLNGTISTSAVPEPSTVGLLALSALGLAAARRRDRRDQS